MVSWGEGVRRICIGSVRCGKAIQSPSYYIPLAFGVLLIYYSLQWTVTIQEQRSSILRTLEAIDEFIASFIDGINSFVEVGSR